MHKQLDRTLMHLGECLQYVFLFSFSLLLFFLVFFALSFFSDKVFIDMLHTVVTYLTGMFFVTQPIVPKIIDVLSKNGSEPAVFPFPVDYYHLDTKKYYLCIIGLTYLFVSWGLLVTIALDVIVIVYVQHCCGIFAALGSV